MNQPERECWRQQPRLFFPMAKERCNSGWAARFISARWPITRAPRLALFRSRRVEDGGAPQRMKRRSVQKAPAAIPLTGWSISPPPHRTAMRASMAAPSKHALRSQQPHRTQVRNARQARLGVGSQFPGQLPPEPADVCASFDGKWEAFIQNFNVFVKPVGKQPAFPLSVDGSEGNVYTLRSVAWSPDSKKLAAYHTRPGYDREITYIESSPSDQIQPKHTAIAYRKPGDALDIAYPVLFDLASQERN